MGIVGLVLAIFCNLIGLVVSIIAFNKSKEAGFKNNIALAGIIVGAVFFVLTSIYKLTVLAGIDGADGRLDPRLQGRSLVTRSGRPSARPGHLPASRDAADAAMIGW